jgi:hypothetical protein
MKTILVPVSGGRSDRAVIDMAHSIAQPFVLGHAAHRLELGRLAISQSDCAN